MPETKRQFRRPPEESIVLDDFSAGMEIRNSKTNPSRIIGNMYPSRDGGLEGVRGDYTYIAGTTIQWSGGTASSWIQDLHNEYIGIFREDETKFFILDNSGNVSTHNNTVQYGTKAYAVPKYASKILSTTIGGWTVHGNPWQGWYESIRGLMAHPSTGNDLIGGLTGAFDIYSKDRYVPSKYLSITESGFFTEKTSGTTANQGIKTQQLGLPTPIATGLHISGDTGTPFAGSRALTNAREDTVTTGAIDNMVQYNQFAICTDNHSDSLFAPLIHKFHIDSTNHELVHNIYTQAGGQRIYTDEVDINGAYAIDQGKPIACAAVPNGNVFCAFIKNNTEITIKRFDPPSTSGNHASDNVYTPTSHDVTLTHPIGVQMAYDEFSEKLFMFITDDIDNDYTKDTTGVNSAANSSIIRVLKIGKAQAPSDVAHHGIIAHPINNKSIQQFTADFICDGYEGDGNLSSATKKCLFAMIDGEDTTDQTDLHWGYFDTDITGGATTLLSCCNTDGGDLTIATQDLTNPLNGGKIEGNRTELNRKFALQMGASSRNGATAMVAISYGSDHCGWDTDKKGIFVYKSKNCSIEKPDLSIDGGNFSFNQCVGGVHGLDAGTDYTGIIGRVKYWRAVDMKMETWEHYNDTTEGVRYVFPGHRGDCLNRMPIHGRYHFLRYEITDTSPNNIMKIHYNIRVDSFDKYEGETKTNVQHSWAGGGGNWNDSEHLQHAHEQSFTGNANNPQGFLPGQLQSAPLEQTGYPSGNIDKTLGTSTAPHWRERQSHTGTNWDAFKASGTLTDQDYDFPSLFYPLTRLGNPFLTYGSYGGPAGYTSVQLGTMCHPSIHGGSVLNAESGLNSNATGRVDFNADMRRYSENKLWYLRHQRLYSGANFHPLTPFVFDSGQKGKKDPRHKTWNGKDPMLAGQDINVISNVETIDGEVKPGRYRYKFSFAKAGAEEKAYRSTGGEGAIFWDDKIEAFFEWDSTRAVTDKGLRIYFNMGLLRNYGGSEATHLIELNDALTDGSSTDIRIKPVWDGVPANTMTLDRTNAPNCHYDYWNGYDIITSPFSSNTYSHFAFDVDNDGGGDSADTLIAASMLEDADPYGYKLRTIDPATLSSTWQHDTNGQNLSAGDQLYRHGLRNLGKTTHVVNDSSGEPEPPYIKKLIIWRTGDVSKPTTDKSKYYKVGEFDLFNEEDTEGWEDYYFDDVYSTLDTSGKQGSRDNLPPVTDNVTSVAASGGRLFVSNTPTTSIGEAKGMKPSEIQYSGKHWENFPRSNIVVLDETAVVLHMKDHQGTLFIYTDKGVYALTDTIEVEQMKARKISSVIIHKHSRDGDRTLSVGGEFFTLGKDGLYSLVQGGMLNVSHQVKEWFEKKVNVPLGMYYDSFTSSVCVYQKETTATAEGTPVDEITVKRGTDPRYMEAVCLHLPTSSWWCRLNDYDELRNYTDVVELAMNQETGSPQRYLPHPLVYGVRKDGNSSITDNIIHIGRGYGQCKVDDTTGATGSVEYIYETSSLGDAKVERYWDKVDVELVPDVASISPTYNLYLTLDAFSSQTPTMSYGSETTLGYTCVTGTSDETLVSVPSVIRTAATDKKNEFARARIRFNWHNSLDASKLIPPKISAIKFRTRVVGVDRTA